MRSHIANSKILQALQKYTYCVVTHKNDKMASRTRYIKICIYPIANLSSTRNIKLQAFNYQMINRIIKTKSNLKKWNVSDDSYCCYCTNNGNYTCMPQLNVIGHATKFWISWGEIKASFSVRTLFRKIYIEVLTDKRYKKMSQFSRKWREFEHIVQQREQYGKINGYFW